MGAFRGSALLQTNGNLCLVVLAGVPNTHSGSSLGSRKSEDRLP